MENIPNDVFDTLPKDAERLLCLMYIYNEFGSYFDSDNLNEMRLASKILDMTEDQILNNVALLHERGLIVRDEEW